MIIITNERLCQLLPQINLISDESLRSKTLDIWRETCELSSWTSLEEIPFGPGLLPNEFSFLQHVTDVTRYSYMVALEHNKTNIHKANIDYVLAGALLHDVCKLMEYSAEDGFTEWGALIPHSMYGVYICKKYDIPLPIIHIVATHTPQVKMSGKSIEAIIVANSDRIAADIVHLYDGSVTK